MTFPPPACSQPSTTFPKQILPKFQVLEESWIQLEVKINGKSLEPHEEFLGKLHNMETIRKAWNINICPSWCQSSRKNEERLARELSINTRSKGQPRMRGIVGQFFHFLHPKGIKHPGDARSRWVPRECCTMGWKLWEWGWRRAGLGQRG